MVSDILASLFIDRFKMSDNITISWFLFSITFPDPLEILFLLEYLLLHSYSNFQYFLTQFTIYTINLIDSKSSGFDLMQTQKLFSLSIFECTFYFYIMFVISKH